MGNRRRARECALQLLYDLEFGYSSKGREASTFSAFWKAFGEDVGNIDGEIQDFAEILVRGVQKNEDDIDELIRGASTNWKLERMARVDRNILRLAAFELVYMPDIPRKVSLNEAIEIAKRFGSEDSSSFINGILDKISSQL